MNIRKIISLLLCIIALATFLFGCANQQEAQQEERYLSVTAAAPTPTTAPMSTDTQAEIEYRWTAYEDMWLDFYASEEIPASINSFDEFHAILSSLLASKNITSQLEQAKNLFGGDAQGYDNIAFTDYDDITYLMSMERIEPLTDSGKAYMEINFRHGDEALFNYLQDKAAEKFVLWESGTQYSRPVSIYKGAFEGSIYTMAIKFDENNVESDSSDSIEITISVDKEYIYKQKDNRYANMQYSAEALDAIYPEFVEFQKSTSFGTATAQAVTAIYASLLPDKDGYVTPEMLCAFELGNAAVISDSVMDENGEYLDMTFARTAKSTGHGDTYQLVGLTPFSQTLLSPTDIDSNLTCIVTFGFKSFPNLIGVSKLFTDEYQKVTATMIDNAKTDEIALTTYASKQNLNDYSMEILTEDAETGFELYKQLCAALLQYYETETDNVALALLPYWSDSMAFPDGSITSPKFQNITVSLQEETKVAISFALPEDFIIPSDSGALK